MQYPLKCCCVLIWAMFGLGSRSCPQDNRHSKERDSQSTGRVLKKYSAVVIFALRRYMIEWNIDTVEDKICTNEKIDLRIANYAEQLWT